MNIHLCLGIGGTIFYILHFLPELPSGTYPLLMFVIPVGLACLFSFLAIAWILERCGVRVYATQLDQQWDESTQATSAEPNAVSNDGPVKELGRPDVSEGPTSVN